MEEINRTLIDWNPWHDGEFPEELQGIKRKIDLTKYLDFKEIKLIEGARRVGKSTLIYQVIKHLLGKTDKILYVNFEDEILKKYTLSEIYDSFLEIKEIDYLFIDEVQNCKEWASFVKKMYDTRKIKQIYITGSNASLIKQDFATLLTGRTIKIKIKPLTFEEYLRFKNINPLPMSTQKKAKIKQSFSKYLNNGGFPEVAKREYAKREILTNYFEDFLYKDIVTRYNVNAEKIKDLSIYLATNAGKIISHRKLGKTLNLNVMTVQDYINYLKEIYLLKEIYRYDPSLKKQFSSLKKPYFIDTGIVNTISFRFSEDFGRVLENLVFNNLEDAYLFQGKHECDFIIKEGLKIKKAIQVTSSIKNPETKRRELNGLLEAMDKHNLKEGLLLTFDEKDEFKIGKKKVIIKPVWEWLLEKNE